MKRKSVTLLNQLKLDVDNVLEEIRDLTFDIEESGSELADMPASQLVSNDEEFKFMFNDLAKKHRDLGKLLTSFRKVRASYLEFF